VPAEDALRINQTRCNDRGRISCRYTIYIVFAASFTWLGLSVDVAVPVGEGLKPEALEWLTAFATANGRPLLYRIGEEWYAFGPPAFQTEMHERIGRGEQPWAEPSC
jgi:hypothetical protein